MEAFADRGLELGWIRLFDVCQTTLSLSTVTLADARQGKLVDEGSAEESYQKRYDGEDAWSLDVRSTKVLFGSSHIESAVDTLCLERPWRFVPFGSRSD